MSSVRTANAESKLMAFGRPSGTAARRSRPAPGSTTARQLQREAAIRAARERARQGLRCFDTVVQRDLDRRPAGAVPLSRSATGSASAPSSGIDTVIAGSPGARRSVSPGSMARCSRLATRTGDGHVRSRGIRRRSACPVGLPQLGMHRGVRDCLPEQGVGVERDLDRRRGGRLSGAGCAAARWDSVPSRQMAVIRVIRADMGTHREVFETACKDRVHDCRAAQDRPGAKARRHPQSLLKQALALRISGVSSPSTGLVDVAQGFSPRACSGPREPSGRT